MGLVVALSLPVGTSLPEMNERTYAMDENASRLAKLRHCELLTRSGPRAVLARGALLALLANIAGAAVLYGLHIVLARQMGHQHYGIYAFVASWMNLLLILATFGLPQTLVRYLPVYEARGELSLFRGLLRWADALSLAISVGLATVLVVIAATLPQSVLAEITEVPDALRFALILGAIAVPIMTMKTIKTQTLRALGGAAWSVSLERVCRPALMLVLAVGVALGIGIQLTGQLAVALHAISFAVLAFAARSIYKHRVPEGAANAKPRRDSRSWLMMSIPSILTAGMLVVLESTDRVMLGMLLNTTEVGIYSAAVRTANLVTFALAAVNAVLGPMVAGMYARGEIVHLQRLLTLAARVLLLWTVCGSLLLLLLGDHILRFFGPGFDAGYAPLATMVAFRIAVSCCGSVVLLLNMTGHQNRVATVLIGSALLNVVLNRCMIPELGMTGAALATGATTLVWNFALLASVMKLVQLNPTVFSWCRSRGQDGL